MNKKVVVLHSQPPSFEEVLKESMFAQYRKERVITYNNKICTFVNAKFRIKNMATGKVVTCDTIGEAVTNML